MPSKYERTSTPGIYRRGKNYVIKQRDRTGRMHARSASTMSEAKNIQATRRPGAAHGTLIVETRELRRLRASMGEVVCGPHVARLPLLDSRGARTIAATARDTVLRSDATD